jgi:hypothetical protein
MKNLTIAFMVAAAFTTVGCKKKGGAGEAMAKMGEFKDKMCACKDKKCADDVQDQMNKWSAENAKNAGDKPEKPDEKTMKEMQEVGTKYGECMAKAMGGGETPPPPPETGSGSAGSGSAAAAPAGDAPKVGEGPVASALSLVKFSLPPFKGGPEKASDKAIWSSAEAETDGNRLTNYMDGDKPFIGVQFLDCNLPTLKDYLSKAPTERGIFQACFEKPTGKLKEFPMAANGENQRTVWAGHVTLTVTVTGPQEGKIKGADLEEWLNTVDLAALSKL